MNNVICAIAKCENNYIEDWINYHISLGFNHIFIYDNNDATYEPIENRIIKNKDKVTITKIPGAKGFQTKTYDHFYHSHDFDWCAFIDIDEYIVLNKFRDINEFLLQSIFRNQSVIALDWHTYGDDGLIKRDMSMPVNEFFTKRLNVYPGHGKSIIKGGIENLNIVSSHYPLINGEVPSQITPNGNIVYAKVGGREDSNYAYINHYMTKTLSEFIDQKLQRGTDAGFPNRKIDLDYYFNLNEKTDEKLNYLKERGIL